MKARNQEESPMKIGIVFPQTEIGNDPAVIRDFAQAVEELGFDHLLVYDHVLGVDRNRPGGFKGPYDKDVPFHEPFVLFGFVAGVTRTIELVSGVIILPQRQTALVAKQCAEIAVLSGGRLRLGVGVGWNDVEYQALGEPFSNRGARQEEQVEVLRALWENETIDFAGRWHTVPHAGINPRPENKIPIWFGGGADALLERAVRIGDGWLPLFPPGDQAKAAVEKIRRHLEETGRDPASFGIEPQAQIAGGNPERWRKHAGAWRELGATHISIGTMGAKLSRPEDHLKAATEWRDAIS
jgi:probable F420-dependent oxidoreductase